MALLITTFAAPTAAAASPGEETDTWIVTLDPEAPAGEHAFGLAAQHGGVVEHVYHLVLNGFSFRGSAQAADAISRNPNVLRVEHTRVLQATELGPNGVFRIDGWAAHGAGHDGRMADGTAVRIAVLDTGIMPNHVDLAPNLKPAEGKNCINQGAAPNDGQGHGTHVAGTAAASFNGEGVVGVATDASLAAVKVLDDFGFGTDAQIICGFEHVLALAGDGTPTVVNMSLGEVHTEGPGCASSALHQSICNLVASNVTVVAAAGNNGFDASSFFPAAYPEVIATSAFSDLDGERSFAGCGFWLDILNQCDDALASFTNYGSIIDVAAPGVRVYSTTSDGAWGLNSGTSMASPHVAGVAALVLAADPTLTPGEVRDILRSTGECPDGAVANAATCSGHGQWEMSDVFAGTFLDPDGIPEPLINALRAAEAAAAGAGAGDAAPSVSILVPTEGATVSGTVTIEIAATDTEDPAGSLTVEWSVDGGASWDSAAWNAGSGRYEASWITTVEPDGTALIDAQATDTAANPSTATPINVTVDNASPPTFVDDYADSESTSFGTVAGSYTATHADGGSIEAIEEVESGGKPSNRLSRLSHSWVVAVTGGDVATFFVDAMASESTDEDTFTFAYATDGSTFIDMVTIDSTTTGYKSYVLPPSVQGDVTIRVTDANRDRGSRSLDTVWIDHMYIRSESAGGTVPPAPNGVAASGTGVDMIEVTWNDNSGGTAAFEIERRMAGSGPWLPAGSVPAGSTSFIDSSLAADTSYDYRVRAFSAAGVSDWSAPATGRTLAASRIGLTASPYKVKGVQHVDLSWTDSSPGGHTYDVYRDDGIIATVTATSYLDNLGVKGGGGYSYRICESGTAACSDTVNVTF